MSHDRAPPNPEALGQRIDLSAVLTGSDEPFDLIVRQFPLLPVRRPDGSSDLRSEIFAGGRAAFQPGSPGGADPAPTNGSARADGKTLAHLVSRTGCRLPDRWMTGPTVGPLLF